MKYLLILSLSFTMLSITAQEIITYPSEDGLQITADYYNTTNSDTYIILFHQAGWSRGEYKEIAPRLNTLGYHCIAVDQRSGGSVNDVMNLTNKEAKKEGKKTAYIDAFQDIEATVAYVKKTYKPAKIIIWGSSYSSSLVLKYAGDYPNSIDAVLSFSPGEYFGQKNFIKNSASKISVPSFITSAQNEKKNWSAIQEAIPTTTKVAYTPTSSGNHGSRALWEKFDDSNGYWNAVIAFLKKI